MTPETSYTIVVPTVRRPSLTDLLVALATGDGPPPEEIVLVDDRPDLADEWAIQPLGPGEWPIHRLRWLRSLGSGPAAARNLGWRAAGTEWVVFLDDDVLPVPEWPARLAADLASLPGDVAGSQGNVHVPLPTHRRPTDGERGTAHLADAAWITADMAYRRSALAEVRGFDERFRHAYREDTDLALRVEEAGYRLVRGARRVDHPVRPGGSWASVRAQAGNADDALMRRRHGPRWRDRVGERPGRLRRHVLTTAAGGTAVLAALYPRRAPRRRAAACALLGWAALTAEFAYARIALGPRTAGEVARMALTSVVIPPVACWHRLRGELAHRNVARQGRQGPPRGRPGAVLFDRDGTLIRDIPYNGEPARVEPMPGARAGLDRLRALGIPVGVVTNQSGLARGLVRREDLDRVHGRVEELLGAFDVWAVCPHHESDGCGCRKPSPGLIGEAAAALGVRTQDCVVIGDIGGDMAAAGAVGARAILVPTPDTRRDELRQAPEVARDLADAVDRALRGEPR
ncbi:MAG: HAD-IIIA family hydrolase [Streptosporangiales bacterium]|nr:HAD-IIIA family hydrolase [Streptosporangiales bacterium]